ncbi:MAG: redoxin domain-containing protein [Phycisphaeraceae bacterium]|nr:redoxin domain-containing protein [Phycisphaeraceae bacterium]
MRHLPAAVALCAFATASALVAQDAPRPMPFPQVVNLPLLWPGEATINTELSDGVNEIKKGDVLKVHSLEPQGVVVVMPDGELMMLQHDWTDVGARAATIAQKLPEDMRRLTVADLAKRDDLFPERLAVTTVIDFTDGRSVPVGTEFVPGRIVAVRGGATMFGIHADMPESGEIQRTYFDISYTDFVDRIRDTVLNHPEKIGTRFTGAMKGNLVNAAGEPVELSETAEYFLVFHGAGWCGWCKRIMPDVMKFYEENAAQRDRFEIIYVSADKSKGEMLAYMQDAKMPWPALAYDKREQTAPVIAMTDGGTPHMLLVARDGRLLHHGEPIGAKGATAVMQALKRELAKKK